MSGAIPRGGVDGPYGSTCAMQSAGRQSVHEDSFVGNGVMGEEGDSCSAVPPPHGARVRATLRQQVQEVRHLKVQQHEAVAF